MWRKLGERYKCSATLQRSTMSYKFLGTKKDWRDFENFITSARGGRKTEMGTTALLIKTMASPNICLGVCNEYLNVRMAHEITSMEHTVLL